MSDPNPIHTSKHLVQPKKKVVQCSSQGKTVTLPEIYDRDANKMFPDAYINFNPRESNQVSPNRKCQCSVTAFSIQSYKIINQSQSVYSI